MAIFDLTNVAFVGRIKVGSSDPENLVSDAEVQSAITFLNRCLNENPRGKIIGVEKTFNLLNVGEHQVVLQVLVYHVGFLRKPYWYDDAEAALAASPPAPSMDIGAVMGARE